LKGKAAGLPVYDLLGGACRVRVPVYVNHMFFPRSADPDAPERYAERAVEAVERGYRALKIDPFGNSRDTLGRAELRRACAIVRAVRDAVGPEVDLAIDSHARFAVEGAIRAARAMQEFDPFFFEEPVPPENVAALRKVRDAVDVPIATGERLYTRWGFRELLEAQAAEIVQVDVAHCGGILEARFIAALAETHYVQVAPHSWYGPVSLAASLHLDATIPNLLIQETPVPHEMPAQQRDLLTTTLTPQAGTLAVPAAPGLGVAIDEGVLKRHRVPG
jgi:galactonate dehydratase